MNRIINFLEEHVEKIILVIVGLVCVWLLITRVLFSPNMVSYDNEKFSPGAIDDYVYEQAELLRQKLNDPPEPLEPYEARFDEFLALVDSAISDIDVSLWPPRPYVSSMVTTTTERAGEYLLPRIPEVNDVTVEHIRAVAYLPTQEITEQIIYDKSSNEPNDLDFVTVEAKLDTAELYNRFYESFAGYDVKEQYRDPCLARPIFAAVHLQRQELNGDGTWSDWQDAPRTRIDHNRRLFEIIEDAKDLPPGGLKVRLLRFDDWQAQTDLLQPQPYQIGSPKEDWFPPSLHKKFVVLRTSEEREEKRKTREEELEETRRDRTDYRRRRTPDGRMRGAPPAGGGYEGLAGIEGGLYGDAETQTTRRRSRSGRQTEGGLYGDRGGLATGGRSSRRRTSGRAEGDIDRERELAIRRRELTRKPTTNDVYREYYKIQINYRTDLAKMREPLLFWAHDDTAEPMKSYQYRIRLGVFNPVAGAKKNDVILWSEFSDTTETITIPGMQYFFAKDIQEAAKTVTVTVCKYVLGYWYSEDFAVRQGEMIGKVVESEPEENEPFALGTYGGAYGGGPYGGQYGQFAGSIAGADQYKEPETIDYGTGAVLVDIIAVNDWLSGRNMRSRRYFDMLYSFNGTDIEHMPINRRYWAKGLQTAFGEIARLLNEPKEPLRAWGSKRAGPRRPDLGYEEYPDEYEEEYMYEEEMMMMDGRRY